MKNLTVPLDIMNRDNPIKSRMKLLMTTLDDLKYKDWEWLTGEMGVGFYFQVQFKTNDALWRGRKWYISDHAIKSEIVQTVWLACLQAEEHEAREHFKYKDVSVYSPHKNIDSLMSVQEDYRE